MGQDLAEAAMRELLDLPNGPRNQASMGWSHRKSKRWLVNLTAPAGRRIDAVGALAHRKSSASMAACGSAN
ncbi:hypothetical protein ABIF86_005140 [Bradyrhizobium japonicum]